MNRKPVLCLMSLVVFSLSTCTQADSIWSKRSKNARSAYTDDVARSIGDILTIRISEDSTVDNKAKRDLSKQTSRSGSLFGIKETVGNLIPEMPEITMEMQGSNSLTSKADSKDERKYTDSITVVVIDILPNRNLVVAGQRSRNIAGDIQTLEASGIVRPSDISFLNTISSRQVANFRILTHNAGISAPYTKPGWLGQIFDALWPF
jgi:flagellar L-ring protein precursor FlgH